MADITTMVARLVAAGCAPEIAAQIVAEAYVAGVESAAFRGNSADTQAEERRRRDRERKRLKRENPQNSADVCGIPRNSENASLSKEKKEESKEEREALSEPRPRTNRGHRLPDDWEPEPPDQAIALNLLGADRALSELEKFRDHWKQQPGSKGVKLDWNAAWRNWIRRSAEYGGRNGNRTANSRTTGHDAILAAATRAAGKIPGDDGLAGSAEEVELPFGNGPDRSRAPMDRWPPEGAARAHDGRKPEAGRVLEGEIIAPDKAVAGLSGGGWRRH